MKISNKQLEFIKSLTWEEVAKIWHDNEINEDHWKKYYESKGHDSWAGWRKKYLDAYAALGREWYLAKVKDPMTVVPNFQGGNYKGWKENFYRGRKLPKFSEMKEHWAAAEFLKNLPRKTTIIALNTEKGIVVAEGMHRCAAITKAAKEGRKLDIELYIAMADVKESEVPDFTEE